EFRRAISAWLTKRFGVDAKTVDPEKNIVPVNGTREALFSFAHFLIEPSAEALVLTPNPFYQIYEGAALLAGARPYYINCLEEPGLNSDYDSVPDEIWSRCQLLYVTSPGNPTGATIDSTACRKLFDLSDRFGFVIAADECYSEIYTDEAS